MEFFQYPHHPAADRQLYQPALFEHPQQIQEYPAFMNHQHPHPTYSMPRRAASMTDLTNAQMVLMAQMDKNNETKPRLSKQEVEILENQFQDQNKPSSSVKRQLAERFRVDVARINNWFQNRRAKQKQEKKQEEFTQRQANLGGAGSAPSSPTQWTFDDLSSENQHLSHDSSAEESIESEAHPIANAAPFNLVGYENPISAAEKSLQRSLLQAEKGKEEREFQQHIPQEIPGSLPQLLDVEPMFGAMPAHDRVPFPSQESSNLDFGMIQQAFHIESMFIAPSSMEQVSFGFSDSIPQDFSASVPGSMDSNTSLYAPPIENNMQFPSELMPPMSETTDLTPRPFAIPRIPEYHSPGVDTGSQSAPDMLESRFKSPPPPADIASRRSKRRPAAIGTSALRDKSSSGPKTANIPRPLASPAVAMRRVSSNNSLNVASGRIQKLSGYPPKSPLKRHFSEGGVYQNLLDRSQQNVPPMPTLSTTWHDQFSPPDSKSPPETWLLQQGTNIPNTPQDGKPEQEDGFTASSSSSDGGYAHSFSHGVPSYINTHSLSMNPNVVSPPETPGNPFNQAWSFEVPDAPLLTPGFNHFPPEGLHMHQPQAQYLSSLTSSQPPTPAFGQFSTMPFYNNASPLCEAQQDGADNDYGNVWLANNGSYSSLPTMPSLTGTPDAIKAAEKSADKTNTFINSTQKDFA